MFIMWVEIINQILKQKKGKIMPKKKRIDQCDQQKALYEWAEEALFFDDVPQFLQFCRQDMYEPTEVVSYSEFLTLKEKFEA